MKKALVTYFSATGTTRRAAEALSKALKADLHEIAPARPYTRADLDWNDAGSRSSAECRDEAARPELSGALPDTAAYDVLFVGFPIWWYVEPRIVDSFLDQVDLAGKTVVPFATSGGSGISRATSRIRGLYPEASVLEGRMLNGGLSKNSLANWIDGLNL